MAMPSTLVFADSMAFLGRSLTDLLGKVCRFALFCLPPIDDACTRALAFVGFFSFQTTPQEVGAFRLKSVLRLSQGS